MTLEKVSLSIKSSNQNTTNVFVSGNGQAVRLPKAYRVDTDKLHIQKIGDSIILTPIAQDSSWEQRVNQVFSVLRDKPSSIDLPEDLPNQTREDIHFHENW